MTLQIVHAEWTWKSPYSKPIPLERDESKPAILYDEHDDRRPGVTFVVALAEVLVRDVVKVTVNAERLGGSATAVLQLWAWCRYWEEEAMRNATMKPGGRWMIDADLKFV
jgi:hypothetical protein